MRDISLNLYQVLESEDFSPLKILKKTYRKLALKHHPDRGGNIEVMKNINFAYQFIQANKSSYDQYLKEQKYNLAPKVKVYRFNINPAWQNFWQGSSDVWTGTAHYTTNTTYYTSSATWAA